MPNEGAHPNIGKVGELTKLEETRVEVLCVGREVMVGAVDALKRFEISVSIAPCQSFASVFSDSWLVLWIVGSRRVRGAYV